MDKVVAIILSAGKGTRMNSQISKQYMDLSGKPVLYYSLKAFQDKVDKIVLVVGKDDISYCRDNIINRYNIKNVAKIVEGGSQRYDSVYNGLKAVREIYGECNCGTNETGECSDKIYVMIHDGARPFVSEKIIEESKIKVKETGACVTAVKVKDTIKIVSADGIIKETPDRNSLWQIQTPQCFEYMKIYEAYGKAIASQRNDITDDAMVMENFGTEKVKVVPGEYTNIKITTPEDMILGKAILENT